MTYTPDEVASAIISEGQTARTTGTPETLHPVMSARGVQIALSTAIVESNDQVLANPNVPASETFPNDGDGYDHDSAGEFQQQFMWWGTIAEEMDPRLSAAMFYHHLAGMNYNDPNTSPGTFAQDVQQSAYPTRYDAAFPAAVAQYNRLTSEATVSTVSNVTAAPKYVEQNWIGRCPNSQDREGTSVDLWLLHTEEGGPATAEDLANFLINSANTGNPVSYHYSIDNTVTVIDVVDTEDACWAVENSNDRSIDLCFAGSTVNWNRGEWLANMGDAIDVAAYLAVQDCQKYGIAIKVIAPPYDSDPPGIADHRYCSVYLQDGNTHVDVDGAQGAAPPYENFPWDVFTAAIQKYAGQPVSTPAPPAPVSSQTYTVQFGDSLDTIAGQFGVTEDALLAANPSITDPNLVFAGQVLNIPEGN